MHSVILTDKVTDEGLLNTLIAKIARQGMIYEGHDLTIHRLLPQLWDMRPPELLQITHPDDLDNPVAEALLGPTLQHPARITDPFPAFAQANALYHSTPQQRADAAAKRLVRSSTTIYMKSGVPVTGALYCPLIVVHENTLSLQGSMLFARAIRERQSNLGLGLRRPEVWQHTGKRHSQRLMEL